MRSALLIAVFALVHATPGPALASDAGHVSFELTFAAHDVHPVTDDTGRLATAWDAEDDSAELAEGRVSVHLDRWEVIGQMERMPTLRRELVYSAYEPRGVPPTMTPVTTQQTESTSLDSFDLALGRGFQLSEVARLTPWVGACYVRTTLDTRMMQSWNEVAPGGVAVLPFLQTTQIDSTGSYLGVVTGGEGSWQLGPRLRLLLRAAARWVGGHQTETATAELVVNMPSAIPVALPPTQRTSQSWRFLLAADAGVEWRATDQFSMAAGWRLRDYSFDAGPATLEGPFVRV